MDSIKRETLLKMIAEDDQGLLAIEGVKYGVLHKGSYWTGSTPIEAIRTLINNFPRFKLKKNESFLYVTKLIESIPGIWGSDFDSDLFKYSVEDLKRIRGK